MKLRQVPVAVRFMILHGLVGFAISAVFVAAILWADPGGVGSLILRHGGVPVIMLLWFFTGLTFGSVQIGAAVMLHEGAQPPAGGGRRMRRPAGLGLRAATIAVRGRR